MGVIFVFYFRNLQSNYNICFKAEHSHDDDKYSNGEIEAKDQEKNYKKQKSEIVKPNRKDMWARPELKVRFIDKKFKVTVFLRKGKLVKCF